MAPPDQPAKLAGTLVLLELLQPEHAAALIDSVQDPEVWKYKLVPMPGSIAALERLIGDVMVGARRWPFVIRRRVDGSVIGSTTLANFDWHHGFVENGFTWLERSSWGQGYNEDTKLALLSHLFEDVGLARVEWQVDAENTRSAAALSRMGFTLEGKHRSRHVRPDGSRRDSLMFGLVLEEWPAAKSQLQRLVDHRSLPRNRRPPQSS